MALATNLHLLTSEATVSEDSDGRMSLEWHDDSKPFCLVSRELIEQWFLRMNSSQRLTAEERESIDYAAYFLSMAEAEQRHVPVLQNLLARRATGSGERHE